ncbi:crossover junction endodeoxyribonuclease RuvC [Actinobaculum suis]|uniref:Crossover junction endodeoxyribonuclease RuvC n=1 Tax=Actinobaculum suis TaxID=1657 RepID=A0A0K9ERL8_9ACTO|nr:crossover junction endodeoxyribonuclease RuvC [Actinobaculum suis]KMY22838.1 crossover junction endodeoxyribonuclease RuvC [Actinobaculum suis]MDY5153743.1 crossover junction endodeoxyribonuclease RuvC [Actinobaculum suis]OCA94257.1 crossover junction endodeoxyribonuclease RuvC [Actinobaculum suis]OCA94512.1 crossover junction endodeoxyribonuclease RuvC [Actinobaculum suis]SDE27245.1 crossover junction endodeoxyribonuclease RuvC [Actinobaculum suis]
MRVLGIDPGLTRCGLGTIDADPARRVSLVDMRVARSPKEMAPHKRLMLVFDEIEQVIGEFQPDVVAIERVFAQENMRSVTSTAQVAGVAMLAAARASLPLGMHSPSEVKAAVTGSGRAGKLQVQNMVQRILRLPELPRPKDAADALAIAICHAWRGGAHALDAEVNNSQHGGANTLPRAEGPGLTPAQRAWASAERLSRRAGAVAPKTKDPR